MEKEEPETTQVAVGTLDLDALYEASIRPPSYPKRVRAIRDKLLPHLKSDKHAIVQILDMLFTNGQANFIWDRKSQNAFAVSLVEAVPEQVDAILNHLTDDKKEPQRKFPTLPLSSVSLLVKMLASALKTKLARLKPKSQPTIDPETERLTVKAFIALFAQSLVLLERKHNNDFDSFTGSFQVIYRALHGLSAKKNIELLVPKLLKELGNTDHSVKYIGLALLCSFARYQPGQDLLKREIIVKPMVKCFNDFVFEYSSLASSNLSFKRSVRSYSSPFRSLFQELLDNPTDLLSEVVQMLIKGFKRSKDNVGPIVVAFGQAIPLSSKLNPSSREEIVSSLLPLLQDMFSSRDTTDHQLAVQLVQALSVTNSSQLLPFLQQALQNNTGEKMAILESMNKLSILPQLEKFPTMLAQSLALVIGAQSESALVRCAASEILDSIFIRNSKLIFETVDDELRVTKALEDAALLSKQDSIRAKALKALGTLVQRDSKLLSSGLCEKLSQFVLKSEQIMIERSLALYGLRVLLLGATNNKQLSTEIVNKKKVVNPKLLSYLLTQETMEHRLLSLDDYLVMLQVVENLLTLHQNNLGLQGKKQQKDADTLNEALLVCAVNVLTQATDGSLIELVKSTLHSLVDKKLHTPILAQFSSYLSHIENYKIASLTNLSSDEAKARLHSLRSKAISTVLLSLLPKVKVLIDDQNNQQEEERIVDTITKLLFYGHHPLVLTPEKHIFDLYVGECSITKSKIAEYCRPIASHLTAQAIEANNPTFASAFSTLLRSFATRTSSKQSNSGKVAMQTLDVIMEKDQQEQVVPSVFNEIAKQIHGALDKLWQFDDEDFEVFAFEKSDENPIFHDADRELTNNPMFRQNLEMAALGKYNLSDEEWQQVFKQEDEVKKKNRTLNTEQVRKKIITEIIGEKEQTTQLEMLSIQNQVILLLKILEAIVRDANNGVRRMLRRYVSLVVLSVAHCMEIEMSDELSDQTYKTFHALCTYLCSPDPFPFSIMDSVARLTVRLKQTITLMNTRLLSTRGRDLETDDDIVFADSVLSKLKLTMKRNVDAESFSVLLPLFQTMLHRNALRVKGSIHGTKLTLDTIRMAMMIVSSHAGLEHHRAGIIRPDICKILIEVLSYYPQLNKHAHSSLVSCAHYLLPVDLDNLLDALLGGFPNVRFSVLKTLELYPPLQTRKTNLEEVDVEEISHYDMSRYHPENPRLLFVLWHSMHDIDSPDHCAIAKRLWVIYSKRILSRQTKKRWVSEIQDKMFELIQEQENYVRSTAAVALFGITQEQEEFNVDDTLLSRCFQIYDIAAENGDKNSKLGVAAVLIACCTLFTQKRHIETIFKFIIDKALRDEQVQEEYVNVGLKIVEQQGKTLQETLLAVFRDYLTQHHAKQNRAIQQQRAQISAQQQSQGSAKGNTKKPTTVTVVAAQVDPTVKRIDDFVTGSVVVFMGSLASFFSVQERDKILDAITKLIDTLKIPSAAVQRSVSDSLANLIAKFRDLEKNEKEQYIKPIVDDLIASIISKNLTFGERKGMAFGLSGIVTGLGIGALKQFEVMTTLESIFKKSGAQQLEDPNLAALAGLPTSKEGALIAFEILARRVKTFEPYIAEVIPFVLDGFADPSTVVRDAANDAASAIMTAMSGHGVRMILPNILKSAKQSSSAADSDPRVKIASLQLLGAMAYCSSRQLSEHLPVVSSTLCEALLTDTHQGVQGAAIKALERVGGVIQNPEIAPIVPQLLTALTNPHIKEIDEVMDSLLYTRFLHSIDAASLALLIPVLVRGLKERLMDIKKKAAQIVGSISALITNPQDLMPYVPELVPILQQCVIDPQPSVRQSSAKAVGTLAKSLGENRISTMIDWLTHILRKNEGNSVERSGAAQTMSEIIAAQGTQRLQQVLPQFLEKIAPTEAQHVKLSYLQVFGFLPVLMKGKFEPFLSICLPHILERLSDDDDLVRETAMNCSKVIIELYATSAVEMLVPALERGLQSIEWRIRLNTVVLLLDFFRRISNEHSDSKIKGEEKMEAEKQEEEQQAATEEGESRGVLQPIFEKPTIHLEVLQRILGQTVMERLLALVFMLVNDSHLAIKSRANELWKQTVFHTPRLLRQMLKTLVQFIVERLASEDEDLREDAARTLGELLMKVGERVIGEVIPILTDGLSSKEEVTRFGVCLGVKELLLHASEKHIGSYQKKLLGFVKMAVCDPENKVQEEGAEIFDLLFKSVGSKIVTELLSQLFTDLTKQGEEQAIAIKGLQQLVRVRGSQLLSKLMPRLIGEEQTPMDLTVENARIVAAIAEVAGHHLTKYAIRLVTTLIKQFGFVLAENKEQEANELFNQLVIAMRNTATALPDDDLETFIELLKENLMSNKQELRLGSCQVVRCFFEGRESLARLEDANMKKKNDDDDDDDQDDEQEEEEDLFKDRYIPILLENLLRLFADPVPKVVICAHRAVNALCGPKSVLLRSDELPNYIDLTRATIRQLTEDDQGRRIVTEIAGFNIPQGIDPLLHMFLQGLMNGKNVEQREQSALAIGDLVDLCLPKNLAPYVLKITGPLIRIMGDRFPWQVKAAILKTISVLLEKCGAAMKPFLPQLQTTFIKSLQDTNVEVRSLAAQALGKLVVLAGTRVDGLLSELHTSLKLMLAKKQNIQYEPQLQGVLVALLQAIGSILQQSSVTAILKQEQTVVPMLTTLQQSMQAFSTAPFGFDPSSIELRVAVANKIALTAHCLIDENKFQQDVVQDAVKLDANENDEMQHARLQLAHYLIQVCPNRVLQNKAAGNCDALLNMLNSTMRAKMGHVAVKQAALQTAGTLILLDSTLVDEQTRKQLIVLIEQSLSNNGDNLTRYEAVKVMKFVAKRDIEREFLFPWVKQLLYCSTKDRYIPVKLASEKTLIYVLNLHQKDQALLKQYVSMFMAQDTEDQKLLKEYCQRVLKKLETEELSDEDEKK